MIYTSGQQWQEDQNKRVLLFAMSGLGKTHVSSMLRDQGSWFHYSIDYRIGTRYMGEHIVDNFKREAMKTPFLASLLRSDSIYIAPNLSFENLEPLSTYLGKPGDASKGGIDIQEYKRRQSQHHQAEVSALLDTLKFIDKADDIYGYDNFVCDTGGSICEVVDPWDENDPVLKALSENLLMVWIEGSDAHTEELVRRFDRAPKPMCYQAGFLADAWMNYQVETGLAPDRVNPDDFIRWTYARAMAHRQPRYAQMATWGITIPYANVASVTSPQDFETVIAAALDAQS